ncbi:MAG: acyl-CoA dehydrogenase family protein [Acidilobaceae archaeon]|nr:acyl-CoA dehydrogenase family protein [Acidilobaceae archaeon]MCX8165910.1 acyl-CoA dehydrogenase family protein [Acidilobaceae archaeon]MDW7974552.1 acyl-CoA dehydrogenase family protein [Sulfolobales archaeon]
MDGSLESIRASTREFAEKELRRVAKLVDERNAVPEEVLRQVAEMGYFSLRVPEEYGGPGLSVLESTVVIEELSRVSSAIGIMATVSGSMVPYPIVKYGTPEQKEKYLGILAKGGIGAFALSEPCCGSDAASITTRATLEGDEIVIEGTKTYITNAPYADFFLVAVRTGREEDRHKGVSLVILDRSPCMKISKLEMMGYRGSGTSELKLEGCRTSKENLIGELNAGFKKIMMTLNEGRVTTAATGLGIMQAAFEEAFEYAKQRTSMGVPIIEHQMVQHLLAEMNMLLETSRLIVYEAARRLDAGDPDIARFSSIAKLFTASRGVDLVRMAMQVMGGIGYSKDSLVERLYRDIKMIEIGDGTNEIQRMVIVKSLRGKIRGD